MFAVYLAVRHFRCALGGCSFKLFTGHEPLARVIASASNRYSLHKLCHFDFVPQFTVDAQYISGADNSTADVISYVRQFSLSPSLSIDLDVMVNFEMVDSHTDQPLRGSFLSLVAAEHLKMRFFRSIAKSSKASGARSSLLSYFWLCTSPPTRVWPLAWG